MPVAAQSSSNPTVQFSKDSAQTRFSRPVPGLKTVAATDSIPIDFVQYELRSGGVTVCLTDVDNVVPEVMRQSYLKSYAQVKDSTPKLDDGAIPDGSVPQEVDPDFAETRRKENRRLEEHRKKADAADKLWSQRARAKQWNQDLSDHHSGRTHRADSEQRCLSTQRQQKNSTVPELVGSTERELRGLASAGAVAPARALGFTTCKNAASVAGIEE